MAGTACTTQVARPPAPPGSGQALPPAHGPGFGSIVAPPAAVQAEDD